MIRNEVKWAEFLNDIRVILGYPLVCMTYMRLISVQSDKNTHKEEELTGIKM